MWPRLSRSGSKHRRRHPMSSRVTDGHRGPVQRTQCFIEPAAPPLLLVSRARPCWQLAAVAAPLLAARLVDAGRHVSVVSLVAGRSRLRDGSLDTGDDNMVTIDAQARSVETTAAATGLSAVHLSGTSVLTATGEVVDRSGRSLGNGSQPAEGTDVLVTACSSLELTGQLRVQPSLVSASGGLGVSFAVSATVASAHLTFQPPAPLAPAAPAPGSGSASATTVATTTTVPPPVPVAGPVILKATSLQISGRACAWWMLPADLTVSSSEADLSWAGSGSIITSHGPLQANLISGASRATPRRRAPHQRQRRGPWHRIGAAGLRQRCAPIAVHRGAQIDVLSTGAIKPVSSAAGTPSCALCVTSGTPTTWPS